MRVLLLSGFPARYVAPSPLGETQIIAGPDWPDAQTLAGQWLSLRTPVGEYDLAPLLAKIPVSQRPDVIVSIMDAGWRNVPGNFNCFGGTKVLLVVDSRAFASSLTDMARYADREPFDQVVFLKDQDHLHEFLEAQAPALAFNQTAALRAGEGPEELARIPLARAG